MPRAPSRTRAAPEFQNLAAPAPPARFLSNGRYRALVTGAGTGFSCLEDIALTAWRGDRVEDADGFYLYVRDLEHRVYWSPGARPVPHPESTVRASWRPGVVELARVAEEIETRLEICVPPDETMEIRRLTLTNLSADSRRLEITSYAEVVLADPGVHAAHPAFSKLFLQTEFVPEHGALLATRRPREKGQRFPWMFHAVRPAVRNPGRAATGYESDRARFLGRCGHVSQPAALHGTAELSGTTGDVLDPIFSLREVLLLEPGESEEVVFVLGAERDRVSALDLLGEFERRREWNAVFGQAEEHQRTVLGKLEMADQEAEYAEALAAAVFYGDPRLRGETAETSSPAFSMRSLRELSDLGLSLARPCALLLPGAEPSAAKALGKAWRYWRAIGLPIDLLIISREPGLARETLPAEIRDAEGVRLLREEEVSEELHRSLEVHARLCVRDVLPDLLQAPTVPGCPTAARRARPEFATLDFDPPEESPPELDAASESLRFFNGYGGFRGDGTEYVIRLPRRHGKTIVPPRPWINVIANERFGFLVSETGGGYTWSRNSREHRLTPWANDPLLDPPSETFHIRDDDSGAYWSAFPSPTPADADYETTHGFGATRCRSRVDDVDFEIVQFVPRGAPLKISRIVVTNRDRRPRRLSLFSCARLVLGTTPEESARFVETEHDPGSQTVFARNPMANEFANGVVVAAMVCSRASGRITGHHVTGDRASFLGCGRRPAEPVAVACGENLDGRTGTGLDPCIGQQVSVELEPGATFEVSFLLGEETSRDAALRMRERFATEQSIDDALREVQGFWRDGLSAVKISTPSAALDFLVNGWLPYQTLTCRVWGRSALYQSGGAYGFRDQLQDVATLLHHWPDLAREHVLRSAAHQFVEGDVLHWWHPPLARGIRTRFADDLLWLPYVTSHYVRTTGDTAILDESAPFLTARPLEPGEDEAYVLPEASGESADLYGHCCRAIDRSLDVGEHGLPFFGTGDWNDGMNRVGREGRGESVWMAFFLDLVLAEFAPLCEARGDSKRAQQYHTHRERLRRAANETAWDGEWYRRGYYDDGTPLGSAESTECRIDALVQAWSVLSGAAPADRAQRAMNSVEEHLISERDEIIRLLTPAFDESKHDPGYIQGYVPGIRENGGQYTHAALWVVRALAELGRNDRVGPLLEMMNPVNQARADHVARYQVEPYVVAADVYGEPPHVGRGGWTWYTGSSGWMIRVVLESLLGFRIVGGDTLLVKPCIPDDWPEFRIDYRAPEARGTCEIRVANPERRARTVTRATIDGSPATIEDGTARIPLSRDAATRRVEIVLGANEA